MNTNLSMVQEKDRVCELIEELERGEYKKDFFTQFILWNEWWTPSYVFFAYEGKYEDRYCIRNNA